MKWSRKSLTIELLWISFHFLPQFSHIRLYLQIEKSCFKPVFSEMLKSIKNEEERLRKYTQLQRKNDPTYRKDFPWYYSSEGYEPEPLNMQGAVGVLIALAGVVLYKL